MNLKKKYSDAQDKLEEAQSEMKLSEQKIENLKD